MKFDLTHFVPFVLFWALTKAAVLALAVVGCRYGVGADPSGRL